MGEITNFDAFVAVGLALVILAAIFIAGITQKEGEEE